MMTTMRWRPAVVVAAVGMLASACAGSAGTDADGVAAEESVQPADGQQTEDGAGGEPASEDCPVPDAGGAQIDMLGWEFPILSAYTRELEACSEAGYQVNVQLLDSAQAKDQANLDLSSGSPNFEVIHGDNAFLSQLAAGGKLFALNDLVEQYRDEFDLDDIPEALWDMASVDGQIYGVPIVQNTMHLFYNPELLAEAGVDVPETYEDVVEACPELKAAGYSVPFTINLHADWAWTIEFSNFIKAHGGDILNDDSTPAFNSAEGRAAAEQMMEVAESCMGPAGLQYSIDDTQAGLQSAELPMASTWASRAAEMDDPDASSVVDVVEFAPALRVSEDSPRTGPGYADFLMIPEGTELDAETIFLAIMGATDLQSQNVAAAHGTVSRSSAQNEEGPRNGEASQKSIEEGIGPNSSDPALALANAALGKWLLQLPDGVSVEEALARAEEEYVAEAESQGLL